MPSSPVVSEVRLITGDVVRVSESAGLTSAVVIPHERPDGRAVSFARVADKDHLYVIPSDVGHLLPETLDTRLFDVTGLIDSGLADFAGDGVPVIVQFDTPASATRSPQQVTASLETQFEAVVNESPDRVLESINAVAATIEPDAAVDLISGLSADSPVTRVWLDAATQAADAESMPQIGAPEAWDAGFTGEGVTVAVLDSGIDATHPDLVGQVVGEQNFSDSPDTDDLAGHGTHVAGIIAGTGAEDGDLKGVAHDADLLNAKVLSDDGYGLESWVIDGMEWSAEQGADILNLSLGVPGYFTDGTDPGSLAVDAISDTYGVLVVVAAGNEGWMGPSSVTSPGAADSALTVGAVDSDDILADFSATGPRAGDAALKPDLTAPGVEIIAARAANGYLGDPVNEHYTSMSGTSMATPHVAGAAALVQQARPVLDGQGLKAVLMGSAEATGETVWREGAGRVFLPAALGQEVTTSPASLSFETIPFPREGTVTQTLTYVNDGDSEVVLELVAEVTGEGGEAVPEGTVTIEPTSVTVPAGGTADIAVTIDPTAVDTGLFGGALTAGGPDGVIARTTVGWFNEPLKHDLTIIGTDSQGDPATQDGFVGVLNVEDATVYAESMLFWEDGEIHLRVEPGTYSVQGIINEVTEFYELETGALVLEPEVVVDGDTTVHLDARDAVPVTYEVPLPTTVDSIEITTFRQDAADTNSFTMSNASGLDADLRTTPTGPVTVGKWSYDSYFMLAETRLRVSTTGAADSEVAAGYAGGSTQVDGVMSGRLRNAGDGSAAAFLFGVKPRDAMVLVQRGDVSLQEQAERAASYGAAGMVAYNNEPGPYWDVLDQDVGIPVLTLSQTEGERLVGLARAGGVDLQIEGTTRPSYTYDLLLPEPDQVPTDLHYAVGEVELAAVHTTYRGAFDDQRMYEGRLGHWLDEPFTRGTIINDLRPTERTEYVYETDLVEFTQTAIGHQEGWELLDVWESGWQFFEAGDESVEQWFTAIFHGGLSSWYVVPDFSSVFRDGDLLTLQLPVATDDYGHHSSYPAPGDEVLLQLLQGEEVLVEVEEYPITTVELPPGEAEYRLVVDVQRQAHWWPTAQHLHTEWTFPSAQTSELEILPLLQVNFGAADLSPLNEATSPMALSLSVEHQDHSVGGGQVEGLNLWSSVDGQTWEPVTVEEVGAGRFDAVLEAPPGAELADLTLKVEAWDSAGSRVEQIVADPLR